MAHPIGNSENTVIWTRLAKREFHFLRKGFTRNNTELTSSHTQRYAFSKKIIATETIEVTRKLSCMIIDCLVPFLELVKLLECDNGDYNVVILEIINALVVMQKHIRIEYKNFCRSCHPPIPP